MEALVQLDVVVEAVDPAGGASTTPIRSLSSASARISPRRSAFGGEAGGRPLQHATQLDRIDDLTRGEGPDDVSTRGQRLQQALVLERRQRQPQRRARDPDPFHERQLGHPLARLELAAEDLLAKRQ